ncbi:glycosyltransferase family 2 protein [Enterocloster sp. OA13]|uniref:glycosyltransferase n=1 Tax=Enterocloster sp. OA13 TaxID=2914161 RepID=UPI00046FF8FC|nr:glycosyltransferase family 2 protein [Enterocloster sp. OA13]
MKDSNMDKKIISVSVIITIHNAEAYLRECLDSVVNQTFKDFEILCIDGGSSDSSPEILREYAAKDTRIRIINDNNTSYGHKINIGMDSAVGEYIAVVESDDLLEPYMLEELHKITERYSPDFVNGEYRYFFDIGDVRIFIPHTMYCLQPYHRLIHNHKCPKNYEIMDRYWTGLYRSEFIKRNHIRLNESPGASFQDMSFRFLLSILADTCYHTDIPVYQYRMDNPGSSMKDQSKTVVIADEHDYLEEELRKRSITEKEVWEQKYYWKYCDFHGNIHRLQGLGRMALFERYMEELERDIDNIPDYSEDRYPYASWWILEHRQEYLGQLDQEYRAYVQKMEHFQNLYQSIIRIKQVVIFGAGKHGETVYRRYLNTFQRFVCCFADNRREGSRQIFGIPLLSPGEAVRKYGEAVFVVASSIYGSEMKKQLINLGVAEKSIYSI